MGGSSKPPKQSDEQRELERLQIELLEKQLEQANEPIKFPEIKPPKPLPPPPPPAVDSDEIAQKMEDERRKAMRRTNTARNTLFAGETGPYKGGSALGGQKTLLG